MIPFIFLSPLITRAGSTRMMSVALLTQQALHLSVVSCVITRSNDTTRFHISWPTFRLLVRGTRTDACQLVISKLFKYW